MDTLTAELWNALGDLGKITEGLSAVWSGCLRDWGRSLRSTAVNKHKALRVFFGSLLNDERISLRRVKPVRAGLTT
ncbi:hypothetical protein QFW96_16105 [Saccharopolyspora sp. TS4A08]|uniref:Transposase n=1 Tax=Saccharopolyspora ipomoeae TaxID=3042027 RepID=A0ABT6PQ59_9PSEU|nr:hypothetical protein [Saccharopolyspora sp. TS4A08]MDI2030152.1 hypothetical protein [Saccharopolyspora sp. TS4A08]